MKSSSYRYFLLAAARHVLEAVKFQGCITNHHVPTMTLRKPLQVVANTPIGCAWNFLPQMPHLFFRARVSGIAIVTASRSDWESAGELLVSNTCQLLKDQSLHRDGSVNELNYLWCASKLACVVAINDSTHPLYILFPSDVRV